MWRRPYCAIERKKLPVPINYSPLKTVLRLEWITRTNYAIHITGNFYKSKWLPLQTGISPLQVLFSIHFLEEEPTKSNPTSQLNLIMLEKVVTVPKDEPLVGDVKAPQSTAIRDKENLSTSYAIIPNFSYIVLRSYYIIYRCIL